MIVTDLLLEVKVIGNNHLTTHSPLKDSDTIRLYVGIHDIEVVKDALSKGITGDRRIYRRYSYENNNNPRGIFSTPDVKVAGEFGNHIIEFHSRVKDLESPVWPSGTFTVQGGREEYWTDDAERKMAMLKQREKFSNSEVEAIAKSSRPEVAASLFSYAEPQALFLGSLNKNSIRAMWVKDGNGLKRVSVKEWMDMYMGDRLKSGNRKLVPFNPRDKVTLDDVLSRYEKAYRHLDKEELLDILVKSPDYLKKVLMTDTQWSDVVGDMKRLGHNVDMRSQIGWG